MDRQNRQKAPNAKTRTDSGAIQPKLDCLHQKGPVNGKANQIRRETRYCEQTKNVATTTAEFWEGEGVKKLG